MKDVTPSAVHTPINFGIGESKHPTPVLVKDALAAALGGLANYPTMFGSDTLQQYIAV